MTTMRLGEILYLSTLARAGVASADPQDWQNLASARTSVPQLVQYGMAVLPTKRLRKPTPGYE